MFTAVNRAKSAIGIAERGSVSTLSNQPFVRAHPGFMADGLAAFLVW